MAKQSKNRRARVATPTSADADFVRVVQWIYRSGVTYGQNSVTTNGVPIREWGAFSEEERINAFDVAVGLVGIRDAIDTQPPGEAKFYAGTLLEALVGRTNTPASRFVYSIRSAQRGLPPAAFETKARRAKFTGFVLALQEAAKRDGGRLSRKDAVAKANTECPFSDQSYTVQAIKKWIARGEVSDADDYRHLIIREAEDMGDDRPFVSRVIDIAREPYGIILWKMPRAEGS